MYMKYFFEVQGEYNSRFYRALYNKNTSEAVRAAFLIIW
jgi:hypothetical protein